MSQEFFRLHGEADRNHPFQHHDGRGCGCQSFDPSSLRPLIGLLQQTLLRCWAFTTL